MTLHYRDVYKNFINTFLRYFIASVLTVLIVFPSSHALALSGCGISISPNSAPAGAGLTATFVITNYDNLNPINWIHIQRPSEFFWIGGISQVTWSVAGDNSELYLSGDSLAPGDSLTMDISYTTDVKNVPMQNWIVTASESGDASGAAVCSGPRGTEIVGNPDNNNDNAVSDVQVNTDAGTSVTIQWHSDYITSSYVYYGTTSSYGSVSSYGTDQVQDHSVTLTGLLPNTGYHFQVAGTDNSGSSVWSADSTFISGEQPLGSGGSSGGSGGNQGGEQGGANTPPENTIPNGNVPKKTINATPPPTISIDTDAQGVHKSPTTVSGSAKGAVAISKIEYSIDNAKNWLFANSTTGLGTTAASYSVTPVNLKDGNYFIIVRVTDVAGSSALATSKTFVIDLLPPSVGAFDTHIGTQSILPNQQGVYSLVEGTDIKVTLSAVGGPTSITIEAKKDGEKSTAYSFSMKRSLDNGLWSGIASFKETGVYALQVTAIDGAKNKTSRYLGTVSIQGAGTIQDAGNKKPVASTVSVYYLDPDTNSMVLWDSGSTNQTNPYKTSGDGKYSFYLPTGTYYLKISAASYKTVTTNIFKLSQQTNVTSSVVLQKKPAVNIGKKSIVLPWVSLRQTKIDFINPIAVESQYPANQKLPVFSAELTNGKKLATADLYGKPTVLSFVTTWSNTGRDQLSLLSSVSSDEVNIVPIVSGETLAKIRSYVAVGEYDIPVLADVNNQLVQDLKVSSIPTHFFIDRRGSVTRIVTGVLSFEEIMKNVTN